MSWFSKSSGSDDDSYWSAFGDDLTEVPRGRHARGPVGARDVRALAKGGYIGKHRAPEGKSAPKGKGK